VSDEAHNASLNALFVRFADVFSTEEVVGLLAAARLDARGASSERAGRRETQGAT
jgi:hypothetical protein